MKLIFVDNDRHFMAVAQEIFAGDNTVEFQPVNYPWHEAEFDVVISPANSFGLMDGGFDLALINHYGLEVEEQIQKMVIQEYGGEQPIGTSKLVYANNGQYIAHTPTMRLPEQVDGTDHIYVAFRAALRACETIRTWSFSPVVATTGLGTGCGRALPRIAARQMQLAWEHHHAAPPVIPGDANRSANWERVRNRYREIAQAANLHG